ncbi:MAG: DUF211 domain-containing protein [Candidatus Odinarchaeia archaeon]
MPAGLKRVVLDVLKPHSPQLTDLAALISQVDGVTGVNISLIEVDADTESVKITIVGPSLDYKQIKKKIEEAGAAIHSIDQVAYGQLLIEEAPTHQL